MFRVASYLCLFILALCPLLCMAGTGEHCRAAEGDCGDGVCEAMAVGALIAEPDDGSIALFFAPSQLDGVLPLMTVPRGCHDRRPSTDCVVGAPFWPRLATRRRALLQTFLF
jgi:hypothetical protein